MGTNKNYFQLSSSLEAVDFQYSTIFRLELVSAIESLKKSGTRKKKDIKKLDINGIIKRHTKLNVDVMFETEAVNAYVHVPGLAADHPLLNDFRKGPWMVKDAKKALKEANGIIKGGVDLRKGQVWGVFEKIKSKISVGWGLFKGDKYKPDEIAAIIAHEVGHLMGYYELLGSMVRTNYIIHTVVDRIVEADRNTRTIILSDMEKELGYKFDDINSLAESDNGDVYRAVITSQETKQMHANLGENLYDLRSFEALADQYASRVGFAVPLATGLDKLYRGGLSSSYMTSTMHIVMQAVKVALMILSVAIGVKYNAPMLILGPVLIVVSNPFFDEYDDPAYRVEKVKQQLNDAVKDPDLADSIKKGLADDIATIEALQVGVSDKQTLLQFFWKNLVPSGRKAKSDIETQQQLEKLVNSDLFGKAAQLQTI